MKPDLAILGGSTGSLEVLNKIIKALLNGFPAAVDKIRTDVRRRHAIRCYLAAPEEVKRWSRFNWCRRKAICCEKKAQLLIVL